MNSSDVLSKVFTIFLLAGAHRHPRYYGEKQHWQSYVDWRPHRCRTVDHLPAPPPPSGGHVGVNSGVPNASSGASQASAVASSSTEESTQNFPQVSSSVFPLDICSEGHNDPPVKKSEGQTAEIWGHNIQIANIHSQPFLQGGKIIPLLSFVLSLSDCIFPQMLTDHLHKLHSVH